MATCLHRETDGFSVSHKFAHKEDIKCAVCLEVYKDPHLLPCLHSFCKTCLVKLSASSHRKIKCPTCRKEHSLSHCGVDGLLPNTYLSNKVEEFGGFGVGPSRSCGQCNSLNVVIFCSQCNYILCGQCHEVHKRMAVFSEHRDSLLPLSQLKKKLKYKCFRHPKEFNEVYCVNCEIVVLCILIKTIDLNQQKKLQLR